MTRAWTLGLLVGLIVGVGSLVAGPIAASLGLLAAVLVASRPPRESAIGGLTVGLGASWLILLGRADLACQSECAGPDLGPWYALAATLLGLGLLLTRRALGRSSGGG